MAVKLNSIYQGDTPLIQFPFSVPGIAYDFTGHTALFTITPDSAPSNDNKAPVKLSYTFSSASDTTAKFQLTEDMTDAAKMAPGNYNYSVKLKSPNAIYFTTVLVGTIKVKQSFTQRTS